MTLTISEQLDKFVSSYVANGEADKLVVPFEAAWPSVCYSADKIVDQLQEGELIQWRPVRQNTNLSFSNVEEALSLSLDSQYCEYFTRYFSNNMQAKAAQGACELLQVWNEEDFERLQQNLIGHLLMKQRLKQSPSLFFGLTDEDDFILTVINDTGEVALEQVGKPAQEILAPTLAHFIAQLSPTP